MSVIAYQYDADYHCESCMLAYARAVPFNEYDWDEFDAGDKRYGEFGMLYMMPLVEDEIIRDSENNPIHAVFDGQEWWEPYLLATEGKQTLICGDCGKELDEIEAD